MFNEDDYDGLLQVCQMLQELVFKIDNRLSADLVSVMKLLEERGILSDEDYPQMQEWSEHYRKYFEEKDRRRKGRIRAELQGQFPGMSDEDLDRLCDRLFSEGDDDDDSEH